MEDSPAITCPVCASSVAPRQQRRCPRCDTPHHRDCWDYVGDCAIFGCRAAAAPGGGGVPATRPTAALIESTQAAVIRNRSAWWAALFRWQWWAFLTMTLGVGVLPLLVMLNGPGLFPGSFLGGLGALLALLLSFAIPVAALTWIVLAVPVVFTGWWLERALDIRLKQPAKGIMNLLERIELSPGARRLQRLARAWPWIYGGLVALGCFVLANTPGPRASEAAFVLGAWALFLGGPLALGTSYVTGQRVLMVETAQNRILASLKAAGK